MITTSKVKIDGVWYEAGVEVSSAPVSVEKPKTIDTQTEIIDEPKAEKKSRKKI